MAGRLLVAATVAATTLLAGCGAGQQPLPLNGPSTRAGRPIAHALSHADTERVIDAVLTISHYCENKRSAPGVAAVLDNLVGVYRAHPAGIYPAGDTPTSMRSVIEHERRALQRCHARGLARRLQVPAGHG
jgi:hypothetical protein